MPIRSVPVRTETLADVAYRHICEGLLDGTLKAGDRLVMDRLAEELGISRTPVRDVLQRLHREQVIRPTGGKGYEVCGLDDDELDQMYQAREAVEGYAAAVVAVAAPEVVETVARGFDEACRMPLNTPHEVYVANRQIHRSVLLGTGNRHLTEMFDLVWSRGLTSQVWADLIVGGHSGEALAAEHAALLDAIRGGSPDAARDAAIEHVRHGRDLH